MRYILLHVERSFNLTTSRLVVLKLFFYHASLSNLPLFQAPPDCK